MTSPDAPFAISSEIKSIMANHTWKLVDLPPNTKTIGCEWIFERKLKLNGSINKFKARLVANRYKQKKDLDYFFEIYSPITRSTASIRSLIALVAVHNLIIHQMNVKTVFLNRDLEEEIHMDQPEGFVSLDNRNKVYKLVKSFYGLKQTLKQ